jgi:hypothetical protein
MSGWTEEELEKIKDATELEISTERTDGSLRKPVIIWVVQTGGDVFIRAVSGPDGKWYKHATENHKGHINAGGVEKNVVFEEHAEDQDAIDQEYKTKYERFGDSIVNSTLTPKAHAATLKVLPR